MNSKLKLAVGSFISLLIIGFVSFLIYDALVLRVTGITPAPSQVATVTPFMDINFNHEIKSVSKVSLNEKEIQTSIERKKIRIPLGDLRKDVEYTLTLNGIASNSGKVIQDYRFSFTPKYIPFNQLDDTVQKELIDSSDSGQLDDVFLNNRFPILEGDFIIEAEPNQRLNNVIVTVTFLQEVAIGTNSDAPQVSNEEAEKLRLEAFEIIKSRGGKPEQYIVFYSNDYLNEKYNQLGD